MKTYSLSLLTESLRFQMQHRDVEKYIEAKKKFEKAACELDDEGMKAVKQEIKKAWQDEEYEISLKTMDEIVKRYQDRISQNR